MNKCKHCKKEQREQNKRFWRGYCFKCWSKLNKVSENKSSLADKVNVPKKKVELPNRFKKNTGYNLIGYKRGDSACKFCRKPFVKKKKGASKKLCADCCRKNNRPYRGGERKGGKVKITQQSLNKRMYDIYISSTAWKHFAKSLKEERGGKCEKCEATTRLTVHHTHYGTLFHERKSDLLVLCWDCHQDEHPNKCRVTKTKQRGKLINITKV